MGEAAACKRSRGLTENQTTRHCNAVGTQSISTRAAVPAIPPPFLSHEYVQLPCVRHATAAPVPRIPPPLHKSGGPRYSSPASTSPPPRLSPDTPPSMWWGRWVTPTAGCGVVWGGGAILHTVWGAARSDALTCMQGGCRRMHADRHRAVTRQAQAACRQSPGQQRGPSIAAITTDPHMQACAEERVLFSATTGDFTGASRLRRGT